MGEGDKRQSRRVENGRDARLTKPPDTATDKARAAVLQSRTATLDDPLTTMLLAEASRRSMTIEVSPDEVAHIVDKPAEPDDPADDWDE